MSDSTPTTRKTGGVAVPLTMMTKSKSTSSEKAAASEGQVAWKGPRPESTSHEPFGRATSTPLKAGAASFKPAGGLNGFTKPKPIAVLNEGSTPDSSPETPTIVESSAELRPRDEPKNKTAVGPIGSGSRQISPDNKVFFTGDIGTNVHLQYPGGHCLKIEYVEGADWPTAMATLERRFGWSQLTVPGQKLIDGYPSSKYSTAMVCFDDLRDAADAADDMSLIRQAWVMTSVSDVEYISAPSDRGNSFTLQPFDGQVIFSASWVGDLKDINTDGLREEVRRIVGDQGEVYAFAELPKPNSTAVQYRVEYFKISAARNAIANITRLQPETVGVNKFWHVVAHKYIQSAWSSPNTPTKRLVKAGEVVQSPTGRTAWRYTEDGKVVHEQPIKSVPNIGAVMRNDYYTPPRERYQSAPQPQTPALWEGIVDQPRSSSWAAEEHYVADTEPQCVSVDRIEKGLDVRTTIMLRNIPNKWSCHDLRRALNATSFGKYDFSYLRIDFAHTTNVGYAFVNFIDPIHIVAFVKRYVGRDWNGGHSRRTAQVSYATVQGYDCLVEKFRNSSIMDEYPDFVPKLWYTEQSAGPDALVGEEKPFPEANNQSKKQRSADNATTIGLYAPNSGHRVGLDRARRSNYDRGTPRQIQEDAAYNAQHSPVQDSWASGGMGYYPGNAPVGTPFPQQPFYGHYVAQYQPAPVSPMHFVDPFASGYAAPYYPPPPAYRYGYPQAVNPASQLRTISHGRLAGRPKNVTVGNTIGMYTGGHVQQPYVPRTFNEEPQSPNLTADGGEASAEAINASVQQ